MRKLFASIYKELLVLFRDPAGVGILFVMPIALMIVVTLVQDGAMQAVYSSKIKMVWVDLDGGKVAQALQRGLLDSGNIELITRWNGQALTVGTAQQVVSQGQVQAGLALREGLSRQCQEKAEQYVAAALARHPGLTDDGGGRGLIASELEVFFDPAIFRTYQNAVTNCLQRLIQGIETELLLEAYAQALPLALKQQLEPQLGEYWKDDLLPDLTYGLKNWRPGQIVAIAERTSMGAALPNSVQQNIPAWSLFGMFFIVIPISTSLLREKQEGTLTRLLTLPVSYLTILLSKVTAYTGVCLVQFGLMLLMGRFVLPWLGTPVFEIGPHPGAVFCLALCAALAATGYGMMVGTYASTSEQANVFGAVSVVILAALGGVMVPTYVMPPIMRSIGSVSPLGWGLSSFLDVIVRGKDLAEVLKSVFWLLGFFALTIALAFGRMFRRD
jgi:ABC-2 type transport system permease protein